MDVLNISNMTDASASSNSMTSSASLDAVSFSDRELEDTDTNRDGSFAANCSNDTTPMMEADDGDKQLWDDSFMDETSSLIFDLASFPTNRTTVSESSASTSASWMSSSYATPPEIIHMRPRSSSSRDRRQSSFTSSTNKHHNMGMNDDGHHQQQGSSPYAQLCKVPNQRTLVTMLEIDIVSGRRKHHSRLPLDAPNTEEVMQSTPSLGSSSKSSTSSCSDGKHSSDSHDDDDEEEEDAGEPIILSGWMLHEEEMTDEEADIYWLLNDGNDVWVKVDDGCAKALKKMWTSCSRWKLKRSTLLPNQPHLEDETPDARDEKRFRYSMLY